MRRFCWFQLYRWYICISAITLSCVWVSCELSFQITQISESGSQITETHDKVIPPIQICHRFGWNQQDLLILLCQYQLLKIFLLLPTLSSSPLLNRYGTIELSSLLWETRCIGTCVQLPTEAPANGASFPPTS